MATLTVDPYPTLGLVRVTVNAADYPPGTCLQVRRVGDGSPLRTHVWQCEELGEWQRLSGGLAVFWDGEAPLDVPFHYELAFADAGTLSPVATVVSSGNVTLASTGQFWLRDPVRPCNSMPVVQCPAPGRPNCVPGDSVFLQRLDTEGYPANAASFLPTNGKRPIPLTRRRRDADSKLVLVSRTFTARDLLLAELDPGSALQFVAPPAFGMPDRYLQVHDVTVSRMTPDHRIPWRSFDMPFTTVDRPVGPAQGVCGARISDLCDVYPTWAAIAATGMSWIALEQGLAGTPTPAVGRTWNQVNAGFANWTAVAAKTWDQIRLGT